MKELNRQQDLPASTPDDAVGLERMAAAVTHWSEKWFPDAYIFAAIAVVVVAIGALATGANRA